MREEGREGCREGERREERERVGGRCIHRKKVMTHDNSLSVLMLSPLQSKETGGSH